MFYRKNIYTWEQGLRIVIGLAFVIAPAMILPGGLLSYGLIATGLVLGLTGIFGWCPMCALAGRRIAEAKFKAEGKGH